jgi:hypothetical protein
MLRVLGGSDYVDTEPTWMLGSHAALGGPQAEGGSLRPTRAGGPLGSLSADLDKRPSPLQTEQGVLKYYTYILWKNFGLPTYFYVLFY